MTDGFYMGAEADYAFPRRKSEMTDTIQGRGRSRHSPFPATVGAGHIVAQPPVAVEDLKPIAHDDILLNQQYWLQVKDVLIEFEKIQLQKSGDGKMDVNARRRGDDRAGALCFHENTDNLFVRR